MMWAMFSVASSMKVMQELITNSSEAAIAEHSVHLSRSENDLKGSEMAVQNALVARSSRSKMLVGEKTNFSSVDEELDAVVSAKFFGAIADGLETVGSVIGNAAVAVGNTVVTAAETTLQSLPPAIKTAANTIGQTAVGVVNTAVSVGEMVVDTTVDLAGTALEHAQQSLAEVGRLAEGLARAAWNEIKKIVNCLKEMFSLCSVLIGDQCDCNAGSDVTIATDRFSVRCVFRAGAEFSQGFGLAAVQQSNLEGTTLEGMNILPGAPFVQAFKHAGQVLKSQDALKNKKTSGTSSSCESSLDVAIDGVVQFVPDVTITVHDSGTTEFHISGTVRASVQAMVEAQGSCSYKAMKGFPDPPKKKIICAGKFCIVIMLQMVAELNLEGTLTGTLEVSTEADFRIAGSVRAMANGHADVDVNSPEITHKQGFAIGASATASARVSLGPVLTIWPVPGIPITFRPMVHAEAKAQGTLSYESGHGLLFIEESHHVSAAAGSNSSLNMTTSNLEMCGAAALNIYADVDITGFALPALFKSRFNSRFLIDQFTAAVMASAAAMLRAMTGPLQCIPGASTATNFIMAAAREAASQITGLIPNLNLDLGLPAIQLLSPQKHFCKEVYTTPGFDSAPCAAELGCKHAGRGPPPGEELPPPEQVRNHDTRASGSTTCPALVMGDRFIQLGNTWRLADIDGQHLVLQHSNGEVPIVWRNDGRTFWRPWHRNQNREAWNRAAGPSKGISFGFQFVQIGNFRIGANDDDHFSVDSNHHKCAQTWRGHDLSVHHSTGWNLYDRGEGFQTGVTFGDRFIQVGKMRFGAADDNHFNFYFTPTAKTLEIFRGHDGTRHAGNNHHWNHHNEMVVSRLPAHWTCPDIAEKAHGECNPEFGHWGDRFIQLAKWRLAAIDDNHFSISHKDGKTAQIYRNDGHLFPGPRNDFGAWHRPIGFPHGITFGPSFIQIGNFRIAAMDHDHMSITHISGITAQIFRGHPGSLLIPVCAFRLTVEVNDRYAMWHCGGIQEILGTCPGITAGDGFLQLSDWRVAGIDSHHFSFSHRSIHTPLILTSDGRTHSGPRRDWHTWDREAGISTIKFGDRFIQFGHWWRLGEWEQNGRHFVLSHRNNKAPIIWRIAFGHGFVQIGKWRIGDVDGHHFSITVNGKTAEIFTADARRHYGPRTDWTTFGRPISDCRVVPDAGAQVIQPPLTEGLECEYFYNHAQCAVPELGVV
ncbi:unnamed protein product [Symbiodinium microadriaticum]|nr:unnamed protein product [Symbiodinium microadriaticum]